MKLRPFKKVAAAATTVGFFLVAALGPATLSASPSGQTTAASAGLYTNGKREGRPILDRGAEEVAEEPPTSGEVSEAASKQLSSVPQRKGWQSSTRVTHGSRFRLKVNKKLGTSSMLLVAATVIALALWRLGSVIRMCLERYAGQRLAGSTPRSLSELDEDSKACKSLGIDPSGNAEPGEVPGAEDASVTVDDSEESVQRCRGCDFDNTAEDYRLFVGMAVLVGLVALACLIILLSFPDALERIHNKGNATDTGNATVLPEILHGNKTVSGTALDGTVFVWGLTGTIVGVLIVLGILAYLGFFSYMEKLFKSKKKKNDPNSGIPTGDDAEGGGAGDIGVEELGQITKL
ncbi:hypothetical protein CSUI_002326 [Cystoisospora suis]|uniref:Transmembrane protein n=1 Tax=Cystoisospora suis TaxID=483139 RepID=A0A2C6L9J9_9APIC|nr:hypothetical protein CSUI_002326 [Cystoisospora suis]